MLTPSTPFHPDDQIRNARFLALYHWAKGLGMDKRRAFYTARSKTLKEYPINPSEPLYRKG